MFGPAENDVIGRVFAACVLRCYSVHLNAGRGQAFDAVRAHGDALINLCLFIDRVGGVVKDVVEFVAYVLPVFVRLWIWPQSLLLLFVTFNVGIQIIERLSSVRFEFSLIGNMGIMTVT